MFPLNYCVSTYIRNLTTQIAITVNDDTEEAPSQMNAPGSPQEAPMKPPHTGVFLCDIIESFGTFLRIPKPKYL